MTVIARESVGGADLAISVGADGVFFAMWDGERVYAHTKAALIEKLKRFASKARPKVSVLATMIDYDNKFIDVTLTGMHSANGNVLYKRDGSKGAEQLSSWSSRENLLRRLSADERKELEALRKAVKAAETDLEVWLQDRRIVAEQAVRSAISLGCLSLQRQSRRMVSDADR
jgi:hypothetical protein